MDVLSHKGVLVSVNVNAKWHFMLDVSHKGVLVSGSRSSDSGVVQCWSDPVYAWLL